MMVTTAFDIIVPIANMGSISISKVSFPSSWESSMIWISMQFSVVPAGRVINDELSTTKSEPEDSKNKMKNSIMKK